MELNSDWYHCRRQGFGKTALADLVGGRSSMDWSDKTLSEESFLAHRLPRKGRGNSQLGGRATDGDGCAVKTISTKRNTAPGWPVLLSVAHSLSSFVRGS